MPSLFFLLLAVNLSVSNQLRPFRCCTLLPSPQMPTLLLPAPGSLSRGLPPSLRQLVLEHPPLRADAAVALADRLSHLLRFDLVWQDAWEIAYL